MGFWRSLLPFFVFAAVYLVIAMLVTNSYYQLIITLVLVWASFGLSWNMLSGYTGLVSFGHAAFFGLGSFATVLAQREFGISPWIMLPVVGADRGVGGRPHRPADVPPARPLLRAVDARLPAGDALRFPVARLSRADRAARSG